MPYELPHGTVYPPDLLREKAQEAAAHRRELRDSVRHGSFTLEELLDRASADRILGKTRIRTVLAWLPRIGTAKIRRILGSTGIEAGQRLGSLTRDQRTGLLEHTYIVQHTASVARLRRTDGAR